MTSEEAPTLLVDTREQAPLVFTHLHAIYCTLQSGDYSVQYLQEEFAVERKSMADLVGSLTRERERFMREMHRLRGFRTRHLLVVGTERELLELVARGRANIAQVEHSLLAVEQRYGVPVTRADSPEAAALLIETWAWTAWRDALAKVGRRVGFPAWAAGALVRGKEVGHG